MTLWCIARSPLMFGGDMRVLDPWTLSLLTNTDVLAMHLTSRANRVLFHNDYRVAWTAKAESGGTYLALFNTSDLEEVQMSAVLADMGLGGAARVRELWTREDLGLVKERLQAQIPPHGANLYLLEPEHQV